MKNYLRKELLIVALFLLVIVLPAFDMVLKLDRFIFLGENRELAKLPTMDFTIRALQKLPSDYTKYFNDHFGFRNSMVRANFILRYGLLGYSPSKQVIIGKNGWLFYAAEGEMEDFRGISKYDATTLEKWAKTLEIKRIWLEKQGVRYLFVVAPNKSTIYGEFLPGSYNRVRKSTALDELVHYLKTHTKVEVVDMRPALFAAKTRERVYHKTDTHWNEYGAFIAYRQIMQSIVQWFPSLRIKSFDEYLIERKMGGSLGLASMIGGTDFIKEEHINLKPLVGSLLKIGDINDSAKSPVVYSQNESSLPRVIVFRDSFFSSVAPFFAEHFQYSRYYWHPWITSTPIEEMISSQKPNIIIEEVVERYVKYSMADFVENPPNYILKRQM